MTGVTGPVRYATAVSLASLLVLVPFLLLPAGEAGLLTAVVGLAVLAWAGHRDRTAVRSVVTSATTVGTHRQVEHRAGVPRLRDPDAAGRPRPRAPGPRRPDQVYG